MEATNIKVTLEYKETNGEISSITITPITQEEIDSLKSYWRKGEIIVEDNNLLITVNQNIKILKTLSDEEAKAIIIFFEGTHFPKADMRYSYARNGAYELFIKKYE